ncbi:MAG: hypothetical protein ACUVWZ_02940 [Anaerolineae bacterium]
MEIKVGRVIRSSTTRFTVGCRLLRPQVPVFGALVKARAGVEIYGLIYDVRMEDDPFLRQMATLDDLQPEYIEDQRHNRQVPIEVGVLVVGYRHNGEIYHWLPPQPPLSLDVIHACGPDEWIAFTRRFDYFCLVLENRDLPADELLAAHLRYAAQVRGKDKDSFLLDAGRELARLLAMDPIRLHALLGRIRP